MNDQKYYEALADYLSNALDRDSDEEMVDFLVSEYAIAKDKAERLIGIILSQN